MGKVIVTEFISVDGVIEDPGGSEDFRHGGWSFEFDRGKDGERFKLEETESSEALLLGRRTYEGFAAAWPSREGEFADKFNRMPKYVVSTTLKDPEWSNSTVIGGDLADEVARLKDSHDGDIYVHGSGMLVNSLLRQDLVDEWHLMLFPVILGEGQRLFEGGADLSRLKLTDSRTVGSEGVLVLTYERA